MATVTQEVNAAATSANVPLFESLDPIYDVADDVLVAKQRYEHLAAEFGRLFGSEPQVFARAPGRVNLIGEHIDYEGYPVLPMAIRQDTIVAIRLVDDAGKSGLTVANVNREKYPTVTYPANPAQEVDLENHKWSHYFLCGYKGVHDHMRAKGLRTAKQGSLQVLIDGIVPQGAGLSSSAALVCSAAIAVMAVYGLNFPKSEVAEFACRCERHIGTQSGGMDQAIALMAAPGVAKLIEFDPVVAHDVKLPEGGTFVIANSLTVSNKAETAAVHYNNRVVECRLAAMVLAVKTGEKSPKNAASHVTTLSDISTVWELASKEGRDPAEGIMSLVAKHLHEEPYSQQEVEDIVESKLVDVFKGSPSSLEVVKRASEFKLRQRAQHVYTEALRVGAFKEAAESRDMPGEEVLRKLGELMNASHESCSKLYECSCPELEELVGTARASGALGARLTGAGWGGCTVSLVHEDQVDEFIAALKDNFYEAQISKGLVKREDLDAVVFASKPAAGAAIFRM